jgi:hypothetical protein
VTAGSRRVTRAPNYIKNTPPMHKEGVIMLICTLAGAFSTHENMHHAGAVCFYFSFLLYVNNFNVCVCAVWLADLMCRGMREKAAFLLFYGMTHACRFPLEKKSRQNARKYASSAGACSLASSLSHSHCVLCNAWNLVVHHFIIIWGNAKGTLC